MESIAVKSCTNPKCHCDNPQPLTSFHKLKTGKNGLHSYCKECRRAYGRDRNKKLREANPLPVIDRRECTSCKRVLERTPQNFYRSKKNSDGLSRVCRVCAREYHRKREADNRLLIREQKQKLRFKNREQINARKRESYAADPERHRKYVRSYFERHPDRVRAQWRKSRLANPEKSRAETRKRKARKRGAKGSYTGKDIRLQLELQKRRCWWCAKPLTTYHVDHVYPLSKGGSNGPENIVISCPDCNMRKHAKTPLEFAGRLF